MTTPSDPHPAPEPADRASAAEQPTQAHPVTPSTDGTPEAGGPAPDAAAPAPDARDAQWRAPAGVPAAPGRFATALRRPRTRVGLAVAGALVVGAAGGSIVTAAVSDGGGHRGRDGHARFDRDDRGQFPGRGEGRDGGRFGNQNGPGGNQGGNRGGTQPGNQPGSSAPVSPGASASTSP